MLETGTTRAVPLTWLAGDMHCHCERHELLAALLASLAADLDFLALTNHPHKPIFAEQADQIARARALRPDLAIFFGCEWNGIGGRHSNLIFPPSPREAEHAERFLKESDFVRTGREPDLAQAFAALNLLPPNERPVLFINHPAARIGFTDAHLDALVAHAGPLFIGTEALHGHQAWAHVLVDEPLTYPGSCVGGLADSMALRHPDRPFALLAHSDFHIHKQVQTPDYPPGVFNRTAVAVAPNVARGSASACADRAAAIFAGLRGGRTLATQGQFCELRRCDVQGATLGDCADTAAATQLCIEATAQEPLRSVELIGCLTAAAPPAILQTWRDLPAGPVTFNFPLPAGARGFVRLRITAARDARPVIPAVPGFTQPSPPPPPASRLCLTSAIRLAPGGSLSFGGVSA